MGGGSDTPMTRRPLTRRSFLGLGAVVALSAAACSSPEADVAESTTSASGSPTTSLSERDAYLAEPPVELNPADFDHGEFVGAIDIEYLGPRTSATAQEADAQYQAYFKGDYTPPQPGERVGIRLNAMGDPRDGDRLLFLGAIIDNITLPHEIVLGLHNITRIKGGVEINGEYFEGSVAGANGSLVIGDRMTIWVPDPTYPDLVNRYVYEVVPSEAGEQSDYVVVDVAQGYEDIIYRTNPDQSVHELSLYTCWPPNQSIRRLVTRFRLVDASIEPGSVQPIEA